MDPLKPTEVLLPAGMLEELEAVAASERRPTREVLHEAVDRYLRDKRSLADAEGPVAPHVTPAQAADRIRESRKRHSLPEGTSIRDLMTFGRA